MTEREWTRPTARDYDGVPPPPRALMIVVVGGFLLLLLLVVAAVIFMQVRPAMSQLLGLAVVSLPIVTVLTILGAVVFRRALPRRFALWLTIGWIVLWLIGGGVFAYLFGNVMAPGQRETVRSYLPFMGIFAPPAPPADTTLPTPNPDQAGNISADDLLSAPLGFSNTQPTAEQPAVNPVEAQPTQTPQPTSTPAPTATPLVTTTPIPATPIPPTEVAMAPGNNAPDVNVANVPAPTNRVLSTRLNNIRHVQQGWNNCGPANITMGLSYFGWTRDQEYAVSYLKPNREDKNVSPSELVEFVNTQTDVRALTRIGGSIELLRLLLANNFPVIVETGYYYEGSDWLGHYETLVGYDDTVGNFYVYDSWLGTGDNGNGMPRSYGDFDSNWQSFNRTFIVLFRAGDESRLNLLLGELVDEQRAAELAAQTAQTEARANRENAFAWFNLGSSLTALGRYEEASSAFDRALSIDTNLRLPWRILWYQFGMYEAYYSVGRYQDVLSLTESNLNNGGEYVEETHYWQGRALAAEGDPSGAAAAFRQALANRPGFELAQQALNDLNT
jgi:tetratricopeptide (TPR) repeat protein